MVPGLCLYPARRQPLSKNKVVAQHSGRLAADRSLARRGVELCAGGAVLRRVPDGGKALVRQGAVQNARFSSTFMSCCFVVVSCAFRREQQTARLLRPSADCSGAAAVSAIDPISAGVTSRSFAVASHRHRLCATPLPEVGLVERLALIHVHSRSNKQCCSCSSSGPWSPRYLVDGSLPTRSCISASMGSRHVEKRQKHPHRGSSCPRFFWVFGVGRQSRPPMHSPPVNAGRWPKCRNCPQAAISPANSCPATRITPRDQFPLREQFRTLKA